MNRICMVLFDTNSCIVGPCLAAIHRIFVSVMVVVGTHARAARLLCIVLADEHVLNLRHPERRISV
jgi:hypothetical protein